MYMFVCLYIYIMEYYPTIKRMKSCICDNMGEPRIYYISEIRQRQILYDFTYKWNIKNKTSEQTQQK